jgi:hypothetical protein
LLLKRKFRADYFKPFGALTTGNHNVRNDTAACADGRQRAAIDIRPVAGNG